MRTLSRRTVLVCGASLLAGCSGIPVPSADGADAACAPRTFLSEPTDWSFPAYDAANTAHAPAASAPDAAADRAIAWRQPFSPAERVHDAERVVVADGRLVVEYSEGGDDGYRLAALDTTTGAVDWTRAFETAELGPAPFVVGENIYYATRTEDGHVGLVLNAADGETRTRTDEELYWWFVDGRTLSIEADDGRVTARGPAGRGDCWEYETRSSVSCIASAPDKLILAWPEDGVGSRLVAVNPTSGEPTWAVSVPQRHGPPVTGGAVRDGRLAVTTATHLLSLDASSGGRRWSAEIGYVHTTAETEDGEASRAAVHPTLGAVTRAAVVVLRDDPAGVDSRIEVYSRSGDRSWATGKREGWWQPPSSRGRRCTRSSRRPARKAPNC